MATPYPSVALLVMVKACYQAGMSKDAAAIVHIVPDAIREALEPADGDERLVGANGEAFAIVPLDDATVVHLGVSIGAEPGELAARVIALLGDALDGHHEERGVPVYPSSYTLEARRWDAAIEELGEAADWVRLEAPAPEGSVAEMLKGFGLGAGELADLENAFKGGDKSALLSSAMRMAQEMAQSGALADIAKRMSALGSDESERPWHGLDPDTAAEHLSGMGLDLDALTKEARRMLEENPELEEQLKSALGAEEPGEPDAGAGDEDDEPEGGER